MTSASGLGILSRKLTIMTYFENSAGLKEGAAVNLQGVTIGNVKSVTIVNTPDRKSTPVKVVMKLDEKFAPGPAHRLQGGADYYRSTGRYGGGHQ